MPSLLTLSDVMGTGHHAARAAKVGPGKTVAVVGDGAVGLCGVIAARRLGAEQIIILGRHPDGSRSPEISGRRTSSANGARKRSSVCAISPVASGPTPSSSAWASGRRPSPRSASPVPGGAVGRVGVPQDASVPEALPTFFKNVTIAGGPAPARAYIEELMPDVLEGGSSPVGSSTASRTSTGCRMATGQWTHVTRSRWPSSSKRLSEDPLDR